MATVLSRPQRGDLYQQGSRLTLCRTHADKRQGNIPETEQNYRVSERNAHVWLVLLISEHTQPAVSALHTHTLFRRLLETEME